MSPLPSFARVLRDHRRGLATWALAVGAITAFYLAFYPMMGQEMVDAVQGMPEGLMRGLGYDRIGTGAGYVDALIVGLLAPLLLLVHAIALGGRLIAGQEEDGSLELDFAAPVSRRRLYLERAAAAWTLVLALVAVLATVVVAMNGPAELALELGHVPAVALPLALLVGGFASVAFAIGAATGRRGAAVGVAAGLAVFAYVVRGVADATGNDLLGAFSPFVWLLGPEPLQNGWDWGATAKLALITVVALPLGLLRFERRDLGV